MKVFTSQCKDMIPPSRDFLMRCGTDSRSRVPSLVKAPAIGVERVGHTRRQAHIIPNDWMRILKGLIRHPTAKQHRNCHDK